MSCSACHREIKVVARGLCAPCYQRLQKRGTTDYAPKRARNTCQIQDCGEGVVSHGLCDMHRNRLARHGHTEQTRPDDWGAKQADGKGKPHPLYYSWSHLRRHRAQHPMHPAWETDFLQFVSDVGDKPTPKHRLYSANDDRPTGPDNFVWKLAITQKVDGEDDRTYKARRQRASRAVNPEAHVGYDLKRHYGLSAAQYETMLSAQDSKCAVCGKDESLVIRGKNVKLAVDHCHAGGQVRALLCSKCNQGLGNFNDDPTLLAAAIAYLDKHALPPPA